jgi:hypothetical protein
VAEGSARRTPDEVIPLPDPAGPGQPPSAIPDAVAGLLNRDGLAPPGFSARLREQTDNSASTRAASNALSTFRVRSLRLFGQFVADHPPDNTDLTSRLRVAMPGRYRIDLDQPLPRKPRSIWCDGQRLWRVYHDRIIDRPAAPVPDGIRLIIDPGWLLLGGHQLTVTGPAIAAGRDGVAITAAAAEIFTESRQGPLSNAQVVADRVETIIDRRLGIALRQDWLAEGELVLRTELSDVREDVDQDAFVLEAPAGVRLIRDGDWLAEADLTTLGVAGEVVGSAARVAFDVAKWLARTAMDSRRKP